MTPFLILIALVLFVVLGRRLWTQYQEKRLVINAINRGAARVKERERQRQAERRLYAGLIEKRKTPETVSNGKWTLDKIQ